MNTAKGYKQTEIGVIPEDWNELPISEIAVITTGGSDTQDRIDDGEVPFFVRSQKVERINKYSMECEAILTSGDGVGVGKIFHYIDGKFDFHQRVYCIYNFNQSVSGKYLFYQFSTNFFNRVMQLTAKSSVDSVRREMIADMKLPFPKNTYEQTAIANALSDMDALIAQTEKLIEKKKAIKQGVMQELLKPKEGWVTKKLGEVGEIITGGTPSTAINQYWNGNIPWITPTDINDKRDIEFSERQITEKGLGQLRKLPENTLLITCIASIGKNAILRKPGACNQQINAIVPNQNHHVDFLYYLLEINKNLLIGSAGITATLILSKKEFSELSFDFPDIIEQSKIAEVISLLDNEISLIKTKLQKLKHQKQGMMQALLTGKIRLI